MRCFCYGILMGNSSGKKMPREPFPDAFPFIVTLWTCDHPEPPSSRLWAWREAAGFCLLSSVFCLLALPLFLSLQLPVWVPFKPQPPFPKFSVVSHLHAGLDVILHLCWWIVQFVHCQQVTILTWQHQNLHVFSCYLSTFGGLQQIFLLWALDFCL